MDVSFVAELWRHPGEDGWHFLTVPPEPTDELRARATGRHAPFGALPVEATIGGTTWRTSLFADRKLDAYLLPVKTAVRRAERLEIGVTVKVSLTLDPPAP